MRESSRAAATPNFAPRSVRRKGPLTHESIQFGTEPKQRRVGRTSCRRGMRFVASSLAHPSHLPLLPPVTNDGLPQNLNAKYEDATDFSKLLKNMTLPRTGNVGEDKEIWQQRPTCDSRPYTYNQKLQNFSKTSETHDHIIKFLRGL